MKPIVTEKAVMMIERENVLTFQVERGKNRTEVKNEIEDIFGVKVKNVRVLIKNGKKYVYVRLKPKFLAIDIATKMGLM
jgi:large subunit ribosomal protein L23